MRIIFWILTILLILAPSTAYAATIKINEFYTAGSTTANPDWVEIFNDGADLSLYQLMDAVNNKKDLASASCNGNFCTIDWYNYLNNSGDTIKLVLKTAIDSPLDQVIYGSSGDISVPSTGQSAGRNPDITGNWIISSLPTKGQPNNSSTPAPSPSPAPTATPGPTLSPSPAPTKTPSPAPTPKKTTTPTSTLTLSPAPFSPAPTIRQLAELNPTNPPARPIYKIASIAGMTTSATPSVTAKIEVKTQKQTNSFFWFGLFLVFAGGSTLGYIYLKRNGKISI